MKGSYLVIFILNLTACGGPAPLDVERVFGTEGQEYCDSLNRVIDFSLSNHLTKSFEDLPDLYQSAMETTVGVLEEYFTRDQIEQIRREVFDPTGVADYRRLQTCQDLAIIERVRIENPLYYAASENSSRSYPVADHFDVHSQAFQFQADVDYRESRRAPTIFNLFLFEFLSSQDVHSRYSTHRSGESAFSFAVRFDIDPYLTYRKPLPESIKVEASGAGAEALSPGDSVHAIQVSGVWKRLVGMDPIDFLSHFEMGEEKYLDLKVHSPSGDRIVRISGEPINRIGSNSILARGKLSGNTIFIRLYEFEAGLTNQVLFELVQLTAEWARRNGHTSSEPSVMSRPTVVLDLRFNPGGTVSEALELIGLFMKSQRIGTLERRSTSEDLYPVTAKYVFENPLIVLVNHASASASELTAQALQESGRAVIVGERTFGKGVGQTTHELGAGSSMNGRMTLTSFRFLGRSGKSVQLKGVVPDFDLIDPKRNEWRLAALRECEKPNAPFQRRCVQRMEDYWRFAALRPLIIPTSSMPQDADFPLRESSMKSRLTELEQMARDKIQSQNALEDQDPLGSDAVGKLVIQMGHQWSELQTGGTSTPESRPLAPTNTSKRPSQADLVAP